MQSRKRGELPATAKSPAAEKSGLHPRNVHRIRYDFAQLCAVSPELAAFVVRNAYGDESINFADPAAVKALNRALLQQHYNIRDWDIPQHYLCPPIPGRVDYLHYVADLLAGMNGGEIPRGEQVRVLDIGTGANCIYPLLGRSVYGWQFVGADVDASALSNAQRVVDANGLSAAITLRRQTDPAAIFSGIFQAGEVFDLTLCNPPFHASLAEAQAGTQRKWKNLGKGKQKAPLLNFGGQSNELYCTGGEAAFVRRMIGESALFKNNCLWFSTLVSKAENLPLVYRALKQAGAVQQRTLEMAQGQKQSRVVAWSYLDAAQQEAWRKTRWK